MKNLSVLQFGVIFMFMLISGCSKNTGGEYPVRPVAFTEVQIEDEFWLPRMDTNRKVTIPYAIKMCEETGRIDNFAVAGGLIEGEHEGYYFNDSDVFKVIEGAAYSLTIFPDKELEKYLDGIIDKIVSAQEEDGYLYTARTAMRPDKMPPGGKERWSNTAHGHELYNVGHMYEGAIAYFQATGKRKFLDAAIKNADLICEVFGPGKRELPPGHQEIEIALGKLYRTTGNRKYLEMAKFFLDIRGDSTGHELYGEYCQDHIPVIEQDKGLGHSVRAAYMYSGMADIAALTGNKEYINAIGKIWENVSNKKLYVTGGIGASGSNEGFSEDYELPNRTAYCETCASIANAMWNHRMFLLHGDAKYMDVAERTIYNAFLSGISMDGNRFFYPNPLQVFAGKERSPWFACACCPSNIVRFLPSLPGYIYAVRDKELYVNMYIGSRLKTEVDKNPVTLSQTTRYPWKGDIKITLESLKENIEFSVCLRIPGWIQDKPVPGDLYRYLNQRDIAVSIKVNGEPVSPEINKGYAFISRTWKKGDIIEINFPMEIRHVLANENVKEDAGKVALERGPIVFCAEWPDNKDGIVRNIMLTDDSALETEFRSELLNGVQIIKGKAFGVKAKGDKKELSKEEQDFTAIPYYAWAHRGKGEMSVWLAREISAALPLSGPTAASTAKVTASGGRGLTAVNDQLEPESSISKTYPNFHYWPKKGTKEWVQYDFNITEEISSAEVYWFDDTGKGECRVPDSWRLLYRSGNKWKPVRTGDGYGTETDKYNKVTFSKVKTKALRLEMQLQEKFSTGIQEWRMK